MRFFCCLFLYLLSLLNLLGQKSEIQVNYTVHSLRDPNELISNEARSLFNQYIVLWEDFEFELLANTETALFKKIKHLTRDEVPEYVYHLALAACSGDEFWYTTKGERMKRIHKKDPEELVVLTLEETLQWTITKESKTIGDFKVFKALTSRNRGQYRVDAIAWFCPDLPYSFGPLGYNGLPGLVLELELNNVLFQLKKVKNVSKNLSLKTSSKSMSFEEYYKQVDAKVAAIKKRGY